MTTGYGASSISSATYMLLLLLHVSFSAVNALVDSTFLVYEVPYFNESEFLQC